MFGPCMCGDTMCPSCGPAQGYDPKFEVLCEKLADRLEDFLKDIVVLDAPQMDDLLETVADKIDKILDAQQRAQEEDYARQLKEEERLYDEYLRSL